MQTMRAPKGTEDLFGNAARAWEHMKATAARVFGAYGFTPIETPVFEQTDVFVRGIGEATDVVGKEMFSALSPIALATVIASDAVPEAVVEGQPDNAVAGRALASELKADHRLSLRPEGTAGVVRAVCQHNLVPAGAAPVKFMYAGPMFRAERPQKGRLRQFHQIGVECLGADGPTADAEVIIMLMRFFEALGIPSENLRLLVNSMGDDACRPAYRDAVSAYLRAHASELCEECVRRADTNPLRAFDCKNEACRTIMATAPLIPDALCDGCRAHYDEVKRLLDAEGIVYTEDPRLVRGLDYYTRTVFEVQVVDGLGAQNALGGGGRYDKLMESVGGKPTPGLGFALGFERTLLALEAAGISTGDDRSLDVYVATVDSSCIPDAFSFMQGLRARGVRCDMDHQARSLKSQLKVADRTGAPWCALIGPDERAAGQVKVRDMHTHEETVVPLEDALDQLGARVLE